MEIFVNGESFNEQICNADIFKLSKLIKVYMDYFFKSNLVITKVLIDGEEVEANSITEDNDMDLVNIKKLELFTQSPNDIAFESIRIAIENLEFIKNKCSDISTNIRIGKNDSNEYNYNQLLLDISTLVEIIKGVQNILGTDFGAIVVDKSSFDDIMGKSNEIFKSMLQAHSSNDKVTLADLIQYELPEIFSEWIEIFNQIDAQGRESIKKIN